LPFQLRQREYETGDCRWQVKNAMNFKYISTGQKIGGAGVSISCAVIPKGRS